MERVTKTRKRKFFEQKAIAEAERKAIEEAERAQELRAEEEDYALRAHELAQSIEPEIAHEHELGPEHDEVRSAERRPQGEKGRGMKVFSCMLAVISFILVLALGAFVYDMNNRVMRLTELQGSGQNAMAQDLAAMRTAMDKVDGLGETLKNVQASFAKMSADTTQLAADAKDNAVAIDEMKRRFNQMIDIVK